MQEKGKRVLRFCVLSVIAVITGYLAGCGSSGAIRSQS